MIWGMLCMGGCDRYGDNINEYWAVVDGKNMAKSGELLSPSFELKVQVL